jgi:hypothetical protein
MEEFADLLDERAADTDRGGPGPGEAWTEYENVALFAPAGPEVLAVRGERVPGCIDATAGEPAFEDAADRSMTGVVAGRPQARGLRRSWRYPDPGRLTAGRRSYLIEVAAGSPPETSAALRRPAP